MTFTELKQRASGTNKSFAPAYREIYNKSHGIDCIDEEVLISETAEAIYKNYFYLYSKTKKQAFKDYCVACKSCIVRYKSNDKVTEELSEVMKSAGDTANIKTLFKRSDYHKGVKLSTFNEALAFLKME